ncbi:hypothetical protein Tco_1485391, partial [Tanacetum coccineum]
MARFVVVMGLIAINVAVFLLRRVADIGDSITIEATTSVSGGCISNTIAADMLHNVIAQPRFTTDVNTLTWLLALPVHTSKGLTIHPEKGFPNAYTKRREVPKTVVQNVCSSRNVRKHFTTGQPSLSANLSSLPTSAEQHLHTTDILKNRRRTTDTNDTITLRPTKFYENNVRLVVWTMDLRHQNLFEAAGPFGMSAPAGVQNPSYNARLVAQGFTQRGRWIDYNEAFTSLKNCPTSDRDVDRMTKHCESYLALKWILKYLKRTADGSFLVKGAWRPPLSPNPISKPRLKLSPFSIGDPIWGAPSGQDAPLYSLLS